MYIARARRSVCIIDTGSPRNRFAAHSHGFFTQDGSEPGTMLATARSQVAAYPTATFIEGEAISAAREPDGFSVRLATGDALESTKLVLAFGISDELSAIPGLAERWGRSVLQYLGEESDVTPTRRRLLESVERGQWNSAAGVWHERTR